MDVDQLVREQAAEAAHDAKFARKSDDNGPTINVRFCDRRGGYQLRPASILAEYPDGYLRVLLHDSRSRATVHINSVRA